MIEGAFLTGVFKAVSARMVVTIIIFVGCFGRFTNDYPFCFFVFFILTAKS